MICMGRECIDGQMAGIIKALLRRIRSMGTASTCSQTNDATKAISKMDFSMEMGYSSLPMVKSAPVNGTRARESKVSDYLIMIFH